MEKAVTNNAMLLFAIALATVARSQSHLEYAVVDSGEEIQYYTTNVRIRGLATTFRLCLEPTCVTTLSQNEFPDVKDAAVVEDLITPEARYIGLFVMAKQNVLSLWDFERASMCKGKIFTSHVPLHCRFGARAIGVCSGSDRQCRFRARVNNKPAVGSFTGAMNILCTEATFEVETNQGYQSMCAEKQDDGSYLFTSTLSERTAAIGTVPHSPELYLFVDLRVHDDVEVGLFTLAITLALIVWIQATNGGLPIKDTLTVLPTDFQVSLDCVYLSVVYTLLRRTISGCMLTTLSALLDVPVYPAAYHCRRELLRCNYRCISDSCAPRESCASTVLASVWRSVRMGEYDSFCCAHHGVQRHCCQLRPCSANTQIRNTGDSLASCHGGSINVKSVFLFSCFLRMGIKRIDGSFCGVNGTCNSWERHAAIVQKPRYQYVSVSRRIVFIRISTLCARVHISGTVQNPGHTERCCRTVGFCTRKQYGFYGHQTLNKRDVVCYNNKLITSKVLREESPFYFCPIWIFVLRQTQKYKKMSTTPSGCIAPRDFANVEFPLRVPNDTFVQAMRLVYDQLLQLDLDSTLFEAADYTNICFVAIFANEAVQNPQIQTQSGDFCTSFRRSLDVPLTSFPYSEFYEAARICIDAAQVADPVLITVATRMKLHKQGCWHLSVLFQDAYSNYSFTGARLALLEESLKVYAYWCLIEDDVTTLQNEYDSVCALMREQWFCISAEPQQSLEVCASYISISADRHAIVSVRDSSPCLLLAGLFNLLVANYHVTDESRAKRRRVKANISFDFYLQVLQVLHYTFDTSVLEADVSASNAKKGSRAEAQYMYLRIGFGHVDTDAASLRAGVMHPETRHLEGPGDPQTGLKTILSLLKRCV